MVRKGKIPFTPGTGKGAKAGVPETWGTFEEAMAALDGYDGIGFEFHNNGIVGIDIDHAIDPRTGEVSELAREIIGKMNSYTEYSPSGTGVHIIARGDIPAEGRKDPQKGIEFYKAKRYFTMTGNVWEAAKPVQKRGHELRELYAKLFPEEKREPPRTKPTVSRDHLAEGLERDTVLRELWEGRRAHGDESSDDIALMNKLAYWCNGDTAAMVEAFMRSPYAAQKDTKHQKKLERKDYLERTAREAAAKCRGSAAEDDSRFRTKRDFRQTETAEGLAGLHPENNRRYGWNDIGNGYLFADWYKDRARYVPQRKKWFIYDGKRWTPDVGNLRAMELCKELADALMVYALSIQDEKQRREYMDYIGKWQSRQKRETILKDAQSVHPVDLEAFDRDPMIFNCLNGTLDLRTLEFWPHKAGDMLSKVSGVSYDPDAQCPRWEAFISQVMEGDRDKAAFLQEALGLALTGDTSHECFFLLYGPKSRNGKGTTMETFMKLAGDYGRTARPDTIAQRQSANGNGPSEDIARLAGARFVNIPEPDKRLVLSAALVKTLTGNDTITARFLNENSFEYRPQFKLFINTNHLPAVTDVTLFSSGRVKVIPFERHFSEEEQDRGLKKELARPESMSGILNWCLEGLWLVREVGLTAPPAVLEATEQYRRDSDKISRFIADELEAGPGYEVKTADAYERYKSWCYRNGFQVPSIKSWKPEMENAVTVVQKRPEAGGNPTPHILGYRLKPGPIF